jgi:bifunctional enzyme CysN/CysC
MKLRPIKICICGSVDDGKSTLVGRILYETGNIFTDQSLKLQSLSKRYGTTGSKIDYALALDGLQAEREQGITIDVAHKYINYNKRRIIFCDSPGHKEYTKNVVTAASQCGAAIILLDASKGVLEQTRRHLAILDFVGIKHFIFAINKMDYVSYNYNAFMKIQNQISLLLKDKNFINTSFVPVSALNGDNIASLSSKMKWYKGKSLLKILSNIKVSDYIIKDAYIAIQHVHRPNPLIRHYMGIKNGQFFKNDKIIVFPSRQKTKIKNTFQGFEKNKKNLKSNIISFETNDEIGITRGDVVVKNKQSSIQTGNAFNTSVCIISDDNLYSGRDYIMRIGNKEVNININKIKNKLNLSSNKKMPCHELFINDLGEIEFNSIETVTFAPFDQDKFLGTFILIDKENNNTVAVGKINFALHRSESVFSEKTDIGHKKKAKLLKQDPVCVWFTGISASGKSTIAKSLEQKLYQQGKITVLLDADNLRLGINKNLGFSKSDRIENVRRIAEIAKLMVESGLIVIVACISPYERERHFARSLFKEGKFFEVFVNTPLSVCKKRDPKGLYKKSKMNKAIDKTGLSNLYEKPKNSDLEIDTSRENINSIVNKIVNEIL